MISIVVQSIDYDKLVLKCIGIALLMINIVVQCIGQSIGIKLLMISIVLQCIDYDKHSFAMHWDCIAYDELSCAIHWDCNAYDKLSCAMHRLWISIVVQCIGFALL